ncbi:MAG: transcriptional repressor [Aliarcobacter sp.]|nr:transcriptional repressor [Aliarcobacter sp.]
MHKEHDIKFDTFLKNFRKHVSKLKLKNSIQKDYILKILYFTDKHLTAEEITYKIRENYNIDIGISTVYRAMKFFEELNIVSCLDALENSKLYELNLSLHHDHLICTNCRKIIEFTDDLIELKQIKIAEKNNFILKDHVMTIYGLCEDCQ